MVDRFFVMNFRFRRNSKQLNGEGSCVNNIVLENKEVQNKEQHTKRAKGTPQQALYGATLGFFFGFASAALFGVTASMFKEVLNINPILIGFLVASPSLSGSLLRIPFAAWVDTTGGRKPFLVLLALALVGMLGLFIVIHFLYPNHMNAGLYPVLLLLGVLCGCGIATFSVGAGQVSYWFPKKDQGKALGFYAGVGNLAPGIFSFLLPFALGMWGLAGSYLAWFVFLGLGTLMYWKMGLNAWYFQLIQKNVFSEAAKTISKHEYGQEIFPTGGLVESLSISAKQWKTWALVAIYFTTFGGFIALTAWFPIYWKSFFMVSTVKAGLLTAVFAIFASLIRILGGDFSDKFGGEKVLIGSLFVFAVGAILMAQSQIFILSVGATIILAVGMGVANAAVFKLVPQEVPDAVGGAVGWVGGLGAFGGFAIPPLLGLFVRNEGLTGYAHGFSIFVLLSIVSLVLAFVLNATHKQQLIS